MLKRLYIKNVRCLTSLTLDLSDGLNIVHGANASGKTSILEAVHILTRGRSFRSNRIRNVLMKGQENFSIQALTQHEEETIDRIAVHYSSHEKRLVLRGNGKNLSRSSDLTAFLPIALVHPDSHRLIDASPSYRRQFLDWGVFHVEQSYLGYWRRYQRALRQRNAVLRQAQDHINLWTPELSATGMSVDRLRRRYLSSFTKFLTHYCKKFLDLNDEIVLVYKQGWPETLSLEESMSSSIERDQKLGYTHSGPHRSDIQFQINGLPLSDYVSRGQQKLMIFALYLSQVETFRQYSGRECMLLIDDYSAELDDKSFQRSLNVFKESHIQLLLTLLGDGQGVRENNIDITMFHVEQGQLV